MKLFIDTDADSRLAKRVLKDVDELGRDMDQVCGDTVSNPTPFPSSGSPSIYSVRQASL